MNKKYGVLNQDKFTGVIEPRVSLVSYSINPIGTLFQVWHGSRYKEVATAKEYQMIADGEEDSNENLKLIGDSLAKAYNKETGQAAIRDTVTKNFSIDVPVSEVVQFVFQVDDATVTWREQLVRQKFIGMWTQSSRTMDMSTMDVAMNPSVEILGGEGAKRIYEETSETIRKAYDSLIELGVPQEDIRLQPLNSTHRVYFFLSLRTLIGIIKKRLSWIAQATVWGPIIGQIFDELDKIGLLEYLDDIRDQVGATISEDGSKIVDYNFKLDAEARMRNDDPLPIDPLYLAYSGEYMPKHTNLSHYDYLKSIYCKLWGDKYLKILGWDRNDPEKLGYYDRPREVSK